MSSTRYQMLQFAALSVLSFVLSVLLTTIFHEWVGLSEAVAHLPTLIIMTTFNFIVLRLRVFKKGKFSFGELLVRFLLALLCMRGLEYAIYMSLVVFVGIQYQIAVVGTAAFMSVLKFFVYRRFVFSES